MFSSDRVVRRLPEFPLLQLRLVPSLEYFLTFFKIVVLCREELAAPETLLEKRFARRLCFEFESIVKL
jgi:hypothetical protein